MYVVWGRRSVDAGGRWPPCLHSQSSWLATASGRQQSCDVSQIRNALVVVVKPVRPSAADTNRASDCKLRQRRQHHQHCCIYNHGVLVASHSLGAYSAPDMGTEYSDEHVFLSVRVRDHIPRTTRLIFTKFLCMLSMAMARSSSGGVAISYVLPVYIG